MMMGTFSVLVLLKFGRKPVRLSRGEAGAYQPEPTIKKFVQLLTAKVQVNS